MPNTDSLEPTRTPLRSAGLLVLLIVVTYAVQAFQSALRRMSFDSSWYGAAERAPYHPPDWVNGLLWLAVLTAAAVSAWLTWREGRRRNTTGVLTLFWTQVALGAVWPPVIFGFYPLFGSAALWAGVGVLLLLLTTVITMSVQYGRIHRTAGLMLIPYAAWIVYAVAAVVGLAVLN